MDNIHAIRHIASVRPSRRAMRRMTDADSIGSFRSAHTLVEIPEAGDLEIEKSEIPEVWLSYFLLLPSSEIV